MQYLQMLTSVKQADEEMEEEIYELFSARFVNMDPGVLREIIRTHIELYKQKQLDLGKNPEMGL